MLTTRPLGLWLILFTYRGYGRCDDSLGCMPAPSNSTIELSSDGAFYGSNEAISFSGIDDFLYVPMAEKLGQHSGSFTIAVTFESAVFFS